jgi:hypothetical protein
MSVYRLNSIILASAIAVTVVLTGCAATRTVDPAASKAYLDTSNYKAIASKYIKDGKPTYNKESLLDTLEAAKAFNDAGLWRDSRDAFEIASKGLAWKADTVDTPGEIANLIGTTLTSSAFGAYQGKIYEGGLIDYYQAINAIMLGDESLARVDFNRFDNRMTNAQQQFAAYRREISKEVGKDTKNPQATTFNQSYKQIQTQIDGGISGIQSKRPDAMIRNSAGQFMSGIFRATSSSSQEKTADRVIRPIDSAQQAAATKQGVDLSIKTASQLRKSKFKSTGKVFIIYEDGVGPTFTEFRVDLPLFVVSDKVTYSGIALPRFMPGKAAFGYLNVSGDQTAEMTNITNIAGMDFSVAYPGIVTKAITSTIIKTAAQYAANTAIDKETKDNQLLGALMKLGVGVAQAATTKADTRVWANLPNSIQVAVIDRPVSGVLTINSPTGSKLVDVTLPAALDTFVYLKASGSNGVPAAYVKALPTGN